MKIDVSISDKAQSGVKEQIKDIHISLYKNKNSLTGMLLKTQYDNFIDRSNREVSKLLEEYNDNKELKSKIGSCFLSSEYRAIHHTHQILSAVRLEADIHHAKEVEALRAALALIQSKAVISGDVAITHIATTALSEKTVSNHTSAELQKMLDAWKEANFTK